MKVEHHCSIDKTAIDSLPAKSLLGRLTEVIELNCISCLYFVGAK
ncbi:hypothetical protein NIES2104_61700 [Leptolyngbya sp. NIES-2104]|nr:hypothetical protein NIES2104_61700 [Leptolyngbya sp. NIES-2104]